MAVRDITLENLDAKIDALRTEMKAGFAKAFEETQGGFNEHRAFTEFVVERSATTLRKEMNQRFNQVDRRFDGMDERFDRLEKLIKGRSP